MREHRAALALLATLSVTATACRPGEAPASPQPLPARVTAGATEGRAPAVRVGIAVGVDSLAITGPADLTGAAEQRAYLTTGERWVARAVGSAIVAVTQGRPPIRTMSGLTVSAGTEGLIAAGGRTYRGTLLIRSAGADRITAVNVIDLEEYLLGVVPHEIGRRPASEIEGVKAQAVAARTYAVGNLGGREPLGFDFYATTQDQLYLGAADEDSIATRAVRETRGEIVTWNGLPILAYYSSTCGGQTAAIEESWPWRAPLPYLKSVSDRMPGTDSAYCAVSNRFRWTTSWTRAELLAVLGESLRMHMTGATPAPRTIESLERIDAGRSGRISLRLTTDRGSVTLRADSVRWVLRTAPGGAILNSSRIDGVDVHRANGMVERVEIRGGGWGHGIGMCQVGALGRARAGQSYQEILLAYYTNTRVTRLY